MADNSFTFIDWFDLVAYLGVFLGIAPLLGKYMANVLEGGKTFLHPLLHRLESFTFRIARIDPNEEMSPMCYVGALLVFNAMAFILVFAILFFQGALPFNPQHFPGLSWDKALNSSVSLVTGTHWQPYPPETHFSYLSHLAGPTLVSFFSGATGIAILAALTRGISRNKESTLGNFWVDFVRSIVYIFLPLAILLALGLIIQGVLQSFGPYVTATTLEGQTQIIPQGPAATEVAIAQLSGGGGGFFNVSRAHPLENPSALSNFLERLGMLIIPGALPFTFGHLVKSKAQGFWIFGVMFVLWMTGSILAIVSDEHVRGMIGAEALMEGKETRIGIANSALWVTITTATGNGSMNSTLSSATPITQTVAFFNLLAGNVIFGPPGLGLCNLFYFIGIAVFLSGLLVGRTPEFLGKQLDWKLMRWISIGLFAPYLLILIGTSLATIGLGQGHPPQNFSEIAYSVSSIIRLNGSKLGAFNWDTPFYNVWTSFGMLTGWLFAIIPILAIAGGLASKRIYPAETIEFAILNRRFAALLASIIVTLVFLVFFPLMLLGPLAEDILLFFGGS